MHTLFVRSRLAAVALASVLALVLTLVASPAASASAVPRVLVYSGTQAYRHGSIAHGNPIIKALADKTGAFTVDFTEDPADITPRNLEKYDIVLFNSPSGIRTGATDWPAQTCQDTLVLCDRAPFTPQQREAFIDWVGCGGGVVGLHQAMDAWHDWPEWDELVGMVFLSHHANAEAQLSIVAEHPAALAFGEEVGDTFNLRDEFYTYAQGDGPMDLSSDVQPLLGIGKFTDPNVERSQGSAYAEQQPMAWLSTFRGLNRTFMSNLGHNNTTWDKPEFQQHLVEGIAHVGAHRPNASCVAGIAEPLAPVVVAPPAAATVGFASPVLAVPQGTALTLTNLDETTHDVMCDAIDRTTGRPFCASEFAHPQQSVAVPGVEKLPPGQHTLHCSIHGSMSLTLVVN
jgi:uncharacterized protein